MESFFENLLNEKPTTKSLQEYQEIVTKSGMMWRKPHEYNTAISGHTNFDDFFKIAAYGDVKLAKFTVECFQRSDESIEYLRGVQFFYKTPDGKIVEGFLHRYPGVEARGTLKGVTFELEDDEYPIRMIGRTGLYVDKFGFYTSKGRELSFGGNGGGERVLDAPQGLYFTRFGSIHCNDGIFSILSESNIIPSKSDLNKKNKQIEAGQIEEEPLDFTMLGMSIQTIFEFLSLKEIFIVFRLNRYFAAQRHSPAFLNRLAKRIIYSCNIQSREYIEEVMKHANTSIKSIQAIAQLLKATENKVTNPFGDKQFEGLLLTQSGGSGVQIKTSNTQNYRTSCFQTSFQVGELQFKGQFSDYFDQDFMNQLMEGKAAIVAGCYMKNAGFAAKGFVVLSVHDENLQKEIFREQIKDDDLKKEWRQMFIKYQPASDMSGETKLIPTSFRLAVGGQDKVYWAGHYGNLISGITFRGVPFISKSDRLYFTV